MRLLLALILSTAPLMAQAQQVKLADMTLEQKREMTSFYGFGKHFLRLAIYDGKRVCADFDVKDKHGKVLYTVRGDPDWQKVAIDSVDQHNSRTSLRTCNGAGKTNVVIPTCTLGHMTMFPNSRVVITSGGQRQVKDQIFPALKAHEAKLRDWVFQDMRIVAPNGSVCIGFSTDDGGKFEGWHGNKDELYTLSAEKRLELEAQFKAQEAQFKESLSALERELAEWMALPPNSKGPLLIIVDEAKSVRKEIYDAIERCTYQRLLECSSCGPAEGEFYDSHHSKAGAFTTLKAPASQCPHADHAKNVTLIDQRGVDDPLVKSKVFADFMTNPGDTVIDRATVDALVLTPPPHIPGVRRAMCDFAAGGDENVLADRNGNLVEIVAAWREKDTMKACGQFVVEFRKRGYTATTAYLISGDNDGLGKVMIDKLHELGWPITRVNNNAAPSKKGEEHYANHSAETWWEGAKAIGRNEFILPKDTVLAAQLSQRKPDFRAGKLAVESKKDMADRGVTSPDRADAVLEVMREPINVAPIPFAGGDGRDLSLWGKMEQEMKHPETAGATCE